MAKKIIWIVALVIATGILLYPPYRQVAIENAWGKFDIIQRQWVFFSDRPVPVKNYHNAIIQYHMDTHCLFLELGLVACVTGIALVIASKGK